MDAFKTATIEEINRMQDRLRRLQKLQIVFLVTGIIFVVIGCIAFGIVSYYASLDAEADWVSPAFTGVGLIFCVSISFIIAFVATHSDIVHARARLVDAMELCPETKGKNLDILENYSFRGIYHHGRK